MIRSNAREPSRGRSCNAETWTADDGEEVDISVMALGPIPGVAIGQTFRDRRELYESGVHRDIRRGICGSGIPGAGAESIVLSGAYEDDRDLGELVYYTG